MVFGQSTDIVSFNAARNEENIALQLQLAPENKLTTVVIERKISDNEFRPIVELGGNLDGNTERKGKDTDKKVKSKKAQYRLKLVSQAGEIKYTDVLSLSKDVINSSIPAPKNENTELDVSSNKKEMLAAATKKEVVGTKGFKVLLTIKLKEKEEENNFL